MGVVEAKIQTVDDIYHLIWNAVARRRPVRAIYRDRIRVFCPHRLGRNSAGDQRVLAYQFGGESDSGLAAPGAPENWRCLVLERLRAVELLDGRWETAANGSRPASCILRPDIDADDAPQPLTHQ